MPANVPVRRRGPRDSAFQLPEIIIVVRRGELLDVVHFRAVPVRCEAVDNGVIAGRSSTFSQVKERRRHEHTFSRRHESRTENQIPP